MFDPSRGGRLRTVLYALSAVVGTAVVVLTTAPAAAWTPVALQWMGAIASGLAHLTRVGDQESS